MNIENVFAAKNPIDQQKIAQAAGEGMARKSTAITKSNVPPIDSVGSQARQLVQNTIKASEDMAKSYANMTNQTSQMQTRYEQVASKKQSAKPTLSSSLNIYA